MVFEEGIKGWSILKICIRESTIYYIEGTWQTSLQWTDSTNLILFLSKEEIIFFTSNLSTTKFAIRIQYSLIQFSSRPISFIGGIVHERDKFHASSSNVIVRLITSFLQKYHVQTLEEGSVVESMCGGYLRGLLPSQCK